MANVVWVVDGVGGADKTNARARLGGAPCLQVPTERMTLHVLHCCALIVDALLRCLETWEVAAEDHHLDRTVDLLLAWVLLNHLDIERLLHRLFPGRRRHGSVPAVPLLGTFRPSCLQPDKGK